MDNFARLRFQLRRGSLLSQLRFERRLGGTTPCSQKRNTPQANHLSGQGIRTILAAALRPLWRSSNAKAPSARGRVSTTDYHNVGIFLFQVLHIFLFRCKPKRFKGQRLNNFWRWRSILFRFVVPNIHVFLNNSRDFSTWHNVCYRSCLYLFQASVLGVMCDILPYYIFGCAPLRHTTSNLSFFSTQKRILINSIVLRERSPMG